MSSDLKKDNNQSLFLILTAGILFSLGFQLGFNKIPNLTEVCVAGTFSAISSSVLVMLASLLPHSVKHKLVFTRVVNEMPAGRIRKLCSKDPRLVSGLAKEKWPEVFAEGITPKLRNGLWYQEIYKPVKDSPEVIQAHRSFLLYRDVFSGMVMLLLAATAWHLFGDPSLIGPLVPPVFYSLGGFTFLSLLAARFAGNRFVVNAVAVAL